MNDNATARESLLEQALATPRPVPVNRVPVDEPTEGKRLSTGQHINTVNLLAGFLEDAGKAFQTLQQVTSDNEAASCLAELQRNLNAASLKVAKLMEATK